MKQSVIFIVGPTAVGKSEIALNIAKNIGGEIVSADSMQVYKEVSIASNKPSADECKQVKHHLIDIVSVEDEFDVVQFNRLAREKISDICARKSIPIVVGGSGLYINILLNGIFEGDSRDDELREQLQDEAEAKGSEQLHNRLKELDSKAAEQIHPNDIKRVIRAIEVCMAGGELFSERKQDRLGLEEEYETHIFMINRPREELYNIIEQRVDQMFERGLVDEVLGLRNLSLSKTAQAIIGVREVQGVLSNEHDVERAKYLMKLNTRHLAKRQLTWFRKQVNMTEFEVSDKISLENVSENMTKILKDKL